MTDLDTGQVPATAAGLRSWTGRQWWIAIGAGLLAAVAIGLPTDVISNPFFGRPVPVTWWSYPTLAATAVLAGMLAATYVRPTVGASDSIETGDTDELDASARNGTLAGLLSFFAVGCPVCNKLVIVALGTTGARQWFEPVQPVLAVVSVGLLAWALRSRLRSANGCRLD